jgi:signal transduction histidine kinase
MAKKNILEQLNFVAQCRKYGVPLWQCPQFLFLIMGTIIIASAITAYLIGNRYIDDPQLIALFVLVLTGVLFILTYIITISFEGLAKAARMKSEFVRIVSHQLRSPLTNLGWAIDSLMAGAVGRIEKSQLEYFQILKENSSRMRELIKDLLITSRIEEGTLAIKREEVSLIEVVKNIVSEFKPFALASNVDIKLEFDKDLPQIYTDSHQVKVVIENLIDNAIRYSKRKGSIDIYLGQKEENIYFRIKDNGIGIPEEDQKFIFKKFFRARTSGEQKGSGLGLFINKSIIERLGGKIWFESEEGEGTTFYFTLPIK